jgi:glycopeptide antibiotics resistance protein
MKKKYDRREALAISQSKELKNKRKLYILYIVLGVFTVLLICLISFITSKFNKANSTTKNDHSIVIDGVKMVLIPVDDQIKEIKNAHAEITKCTSNKATITCIDVAGEKTEYKRTYQQDMVY